MAVTEARVPTEHGGKYLTQLCKHWSHKLPVELEEGRGVVRFEQAVAELRAEPAALVVRVASEDAAVLERMKGVVASHLDRFAFREAPLSFDWASVA